MLNKIALVYQGFLTIFQQIALAIAMHVVKGVIYV